MRRSLSSRWTSTNGRISSHASRSRMCRRCWSSPTSVSAAGCRIRRAAARSRSCSCRGSTSVPRAMPGKSVPFPPMEAELVRELPHGDGWQYEPKWDGFRGVLENDGGEIRLWSRNERPLLRYFPELRPLGDLLPRGSALDGEIVIERGGRLDFDAMQMRLHPAESRIRRLSGEIPAQFIAFDVLVWQRKAWHKRPLEERRAFLETLPLEEFTVSPMTRDVKQAAKWLKQLDAIGLDGVIAKRLGLP